MGGGREVVRGAACQLPDPDSDSLRTQRQRLLLFVSGNNTVRKLSLHMSDTAMILDTSWAYSGTSPAISKHRQCQRHASHRGTSLRIRWVGCPVPQPLTERRTRRRLGAGVGPRGVPPRGPSRWGGGVASRSSPSVESVVLGAGRRTDPREGRPTIGGRAEREPAAVACTRSSGIHTSPHHAGEAAETLLRRTVLHARPPPPPVFAPSSRPPPHNCAGSKLEFAQISAATIIPETLPLKSARTPNKTLLNTDY